LRKIKSDVDFINTRIDLIEEGLHVSNPNRLSCMWQSVDRDTAALPDV
jgi:hypothetical protein